MTKPSIPTVNLSDPEHIECPYTLYRRLHEGGSVAADDAIGKVVAGYDDLAALARNTQTFSSSISEDGHGPRHMGVGSDPVQDDVEEILSHAHPIVNALFTADPPAHTRHRKLISKALSPRSVRRLEPEIRQITDDLIDKFIDKGKLDLLPDFAVPLPVTVIADILGVDRADIWTFKNWGDLMISGNIDVLSHDRRREVAHAVVELHNYFVPRIEERRTHPTDDLLSVMVNTELDGEKPLSTEELLPIIDQILLAGHETTTNLIGNALVVLLNDTALMQRLQENPGDIPAMVEEALRWDPPIQCTFRRATESTSVGDLPIEQGEMVVPLWAGANWDGNVFPSPETFDIDRPMAKPHMGFGFGPHFCAGAELARLEAKIAFEVLLSRLTNLRLDDAASDLSHLPSFASRGYKRIVIDFDRR
ncbi:cytochrome p450 107b1 [Luminiphilus syltensis NOR5-1B]|uniref:Cytochrome p450 107b1 n=1 Tax=Luminiphilus syltensis NOR5-1B TaxID=565045 RepID=B8KTI9_9GAMM|nr:cytochrome P450 [Luminiphilus syltensis]EED35098.1 cytochrome p450 107b1 [Luminiphilus syltensis NOR5-1B]